jgi:hypothetical protein
MEPDSARELFSSPCQHITDHLQTIFDDEKVKGTNIILMVGGFSESPMLRNAVERAFPNRTLIIPERLDERDKDSHKLRPSFSCS